VIITSQSDLDVPDGVEVYASIQDAISAHPKEEIIGFGGQGIFAEMMSMADTLEITHVHETVDACDAFFPEIDFDIWKEVWREDHDGFSFVTYKKANSQ
jgi:dihydrofolate reductase